MSIHTYLQDWQKQPLTETLAATRTADVLRALQYTRPDAWDFLALLSPAAAPLLEQLANRAHELTIQHFGRTISLFTPLYLSNHCQNQCRYCGFSARNAIPRSKLGREEILAEGEYIASTGLRQLLLLTGEAPTLAGRDYLADAASLLRPLFPSLGIEVFPMQTEDYRLLMDAGVDSLTLFQETYDESLYADLHPAGPKRDFRFRLDAPERGCQAGMRIVNIGALLGLTDWRFDFFMTALHADWLQQHYPGTDIAVSLPRMRPHAGAFQPAAIVSDREMVQAMTALRIFLPRVGVTISSRETPAFRNNILPLGVTRMSAGVSTAVGGHTTQNDTGQFDISDPRSVEEMCAMLREHGYQPVFKDWEPLEAAG